MITLVIRNDLLYLSLVIAISQGRYEIVSLSQTLSARAISAYAERVWPCETRYNMYLP